MLEHKAGARQHPAPEQELGLDKFIKRRSAPAPAGSRPHCFRFNPTASVIAKSKTMETRVYELAEAIA